MKDKLISAVLIIVVLAALAGLWGIGFWIDLKFLELKLWLLGE